jgi:predicted CXXCH cytochrome family protein
MKNTTERNCSFCFLVVGLLIILLSGCAPEKRFHILSFLFDGVPNSETNTKAAVITSATVDTTMVVANKEVKPEYYIHKPYEEEKCSSCHESGFSNALILPMPKLCYTCHDDFNRTLSSLHGPVASGHCTACHDQHMAKNEKLLTRTGQAVCYYCHSQGQILKNKLHDDIGEKSCTECHNPHGGQNKGNLKSNSCFTCHKNFSATYSYLHGPVASQNCLACHDSHSSTNASKVLRNGQQLCLFCHKQEQVFEVTVHRKNKKANCTDCHNPHGGEDHLLLTVALMHNTKSISLPLIKAVNLDSINTKIQVKEIPENKSDEPFGQKKDSIQNILNEYPKR